MECDARMADEPPGMFGRRLGLHALVAQDEAPGKAHCPGRKVKGTSAVWPQQFREQRRIRRLGESDPDLLESPLDGQMPAANHVIHGKRDLVPAHEAPPHQM